MPRLCGMFVVLSLLAGAQPALAQATDKAERVLDGFVAAMQADPAYSAAQKERAESIVVALRKDPATRSAAVAEALRELSPEFRAALDLLADEKLGEARAQLLPLSRSADPYLAAEASFQLARTLVLAERFEEARPVLDAVTGRLAEKSLGVGQAFFLRGLCEVALLKRTEAIASLERFLKEEPAAPERLRTAAGRQIQELKLVEDGSLRDVWLHMEFVRRKLSQADAGQETRKRQGEVVALLDKLIEEAEEREAQGQGDGQSQGEKKRGQGQGQGSNARGSGGKGGGPDGQKNDHTGPNDQTPYAGGVKRQYKGPQSAWSMLRENERAQALQSLKDKFPERYKQLLEQYYKNVQDEEEP